MIRRRMKPRKEATDARHHRAFDDEVKGPRMSLKLPARHAVVLPAVVLLLAFASGAGCRKTTPTATPVSSTSSATTCTPTKIAGRALGANVIDLADDQDTEPLDDGLRGYGSDKARATLKRLAALGLNSVVLPVVIHMDDEFSTVVISGSLLGKRRAALVRMIQDAHREKMAVVVVPHLRLNNGQWRGRLAPHDVDAFFASYSRVLLDVADLSQEHCVEGLSIGIELKSLTDDDNNNERFATLITKVRTRFSGRLTYSANWDEVSQVKFWPLLDNLAVNAFFPLAEAPTDDDEMLRAKAQEVVNQLDLLSGTLHKRWWITELGFKAVADSYVEPWKWPAEVGAKSLAVDEESQARGYRAWDAAVRGSSSIDAVFFWMVPADLDDAKHPWAFEPRQGFSFLGKKAESIVATFGATER